MIEWSIDTVLSNLKKVSIIIKKSISTFFLSFLLFFIVFLLFFYCLVFLSVYLIKSYVRYPQIVFIYRFSWVTRHPWGT